LGSTCDQRWAHFHASTYRFDLQVKETHHYIRLNSAARSDLTWWSECLTLFNGTCAFTCDLPLPNFCFATDACATGGGAFCGIDWFYASWECDFSWIVGRHINELERFTVFLSLVRWGPALAHQHVRIRSDNAATIAIIMNYTSRSVLLMPYIREIF
jgi:hypothetical protein